MISYLGLRCFPTYTSGVKENYCSSNKLLPPSQINVAFLCDISPNAVQSTAHVKKSALKKCHCSIN